MNIFTAMQVSSSGLKAQRTRLNVISTNMANMETTKTPEGGPYRKKDVFFEAVKTAVDRESGVRGEEGVREVDVYDVAPNPRPFRMVHDPEHPDADENGIVLMPNVNPMEEMVDMMAATRAYEANVTAVKSAKRMALKALEIGR